MNNQRSVDEATLQTIVGHLVEDIHMNLIGFGLAVDVIVVTQEEIERYKDRAALDIYPVACEGKVVYAA